MQHNLNWKLLCNVCISVRRGSAHSNIEVSSPVFNILYPLFFSWWPCWLLLRIKIHAIDGSKELIMPFTFHTQASVIIDCCSAAVQWALPTSIAHPDSGKFLKWYMKSNKILWLYYIINGYCLYFVLYYVASEWKWLLFSHKQQFVI